ncbi:MAG: ion transporter [Thermoguttaceae bacterium]|nr:ion transporter [Thermoguttaceae bacterium]
MISKLRDFFKSEIFRKRLDYFILSLILLNAVVMVLQCYYPGDPVLQWLDTTILIIFCIEIVVKIIGLTWKGYWSDSWNWFDFGVTMIALGACLQSFIPTGESTLNAIFTLRIFRGFRFFRVLRFIPNIDSIMNGCRRAITSTSVIILAFLITAFIWSIIACNLFGSVAPGYFKDPLTSFYSIFRLFTVEGWYEIPNAVARNQPEWYQTIVKLFFSVLLFLGGIIGMSFINSIIIDAMASDNNDELMAHVKELELKIDKLEAKIDRLMDKKGQIN